MEIDMEFPSGIVDEIRQIHLNIKEAKVYSIYLKISFLTQYTL